MPALPNVPQVLRVELFYTVGEDPHAKNRFHIKYAGSAPALADLDTLADGVGTAFSDHLAQILDVPKQLTNVIITDLTTPSSPRSTSLVQVAGTAQQGVIPASAATVCSLEINRRYRGGHPRIYFPFGGKLDLADEQTWSTAYVTGAQTRVAAFFAAVKLLGWTGTTAFDIANVSFFEGFHTFTGPTGRVRNIPTVRLAPVVDIVSDFIVRAGIGSVRKRLLMLA